MRARRSQVRNTSALNVARGRPRHNPTLPSTEWGKRVFITLFGVGSHLAHQLLLWWRCYYFISFSFFWSMPQTKRKGCIQATPCVIVIGKLITALVSCHLKCYEVPTVKLSTVSQLNPECLMPWTLPFRPRRMSLRIYRRTRGFPQTFNITAGFTPMQCNL